MASSSHTIKERITLDGGAEIEKEFAQMGEAGKAAYNMLKKAALDSQKAQSGFSAIWTQAQKDLKAISKQAAETGKVWSEFGTQTKEVATRFVELGAVVVGVGAGLLAFAKHAADSADETGKAAQSTGLALDQYSKLTFVFGQGNVSADAFGTAMKKLNTNISEAVTGTGAGAKLFDQLGIAVKGANGQLLPTDEIIQAIATKFQKLPDGPTKSALAIQLFGKSGAALIPVLNDGGAAMKRMEDRAVALGVVLDATSVKVGQEFNDSFGELTKSINAIATQIGLQLAPAFTETFKQITDVIIKNRTTILSFTQALISQAVPAIKDLINAFAGNDAAVANKSFIQLRDTIISIGTALGILSSFINAIFGLLTELIQPFVDLYNVTLGRLFGQVTSQAVVITVLAGLLTGAFKGVGLAIDGVRATWLLLVKIFGSSAGTIALLGTLFTGIAAAAINTFEQAASVVQAWSSVMQQVFASITAGAAAVWAGIVSGVTQLVSNVVGIFTDFQKRGLGVFSDLIHGIVGFFTNLAHQISGIIDGIIKSIQSAIQSALTLGGLLGGSGGGSSSGSGGSAFARGGRVRGAGTGTSDSIWARLSNGEYVIRAAAVDKYGSGLLTAINSMHYKPPRFALGGPVGFTGASMPSLAGLAPSGPSGRPFSLTIGADTFDGLIAPDTVASKLVTFAKTKATRSAGRKPTWSK